MYLKNLKIKRSVLEYPFVNEASILIIDMLDFDVHTQTTLT